MGGRSGQSIARAASASEDAPDKGITITGGGLSEAMQRQVEKAVRGQGVTGDVLVTFERIRGSTGGFVGWDAPVNSDDRTTSIFKIKPHIRINRSGYTDQQIIEIAKHEAQHIKQSQSGRFYIRKNYSVYGAEMRQRTKLSEDIYWEGKEYISSGAYASIMKKMGSKDPKIRALAYKKYRDLPWEVEAHAAGDPFK